ncbi:MAG: hypothetical protein JKY20_08005, partial [Alphaproteobacteria bacterium]|nr:hypothetical protein [Alphaproteobacteria bacterium]
MSLANAQTTPTSELRDTKAQFQQLKEQRRANKAAQKQLPSAEAVTFADVLKDPDNVDLNFRFAKSQVSRGDVKGAVGTLERILLVTPELAPVRLFYAIVLYRLDSLDEAEREFIALSKLKLSSKVKTQVDQFLSDIVLRRKKTRYKVQLTIGGHYDSNRNSAPRTNQVEVAGILFNLTGRSRKQDDAALIGVVTAEPVHDLGMQAPHELHVSATYFHDEQMSIDSHDTQVGSFTLGPKLRFSGVTVTPKLNYANLRLSREKLFEGYGAEVLLEAPNVLPWKSPSGFFKAKYTSEEFYPTRENTTANNLDGHRYEF